MARARRHQTVMALMYLDIDHFKSINDSLGHETGDQLLREFSSLLRATLRETDLVSRLGGDEFTVILENIANSESARRVAMNIIEAIKNTIWLDGKPRKITSSIGIALYSGEDIDAKTLIGTADKAMYKAKHAGRNNFKILPDSSSDTAPARPLEDNIHNARTMLTIQSIVDGKGFLQNTLKAVRKHLGMDIAFISHIHDGIREFKVVDSKDANPPIAVGGSNPLDEGYCQRVIDGRLPQMMGDAFELPEALAVPATKLLPVRAHMSVPIRLSNGDIYGTFCCFSYTPDQSLNDRDLSVMHVFADMVSSYIEKSIEENKPVS